MISEPFLMASIALADCELFLRHLPKSQRTSEPAPLALANATKHGQDAGELHLHNALPQGKKSRAAKMGKGCTEDKNILLSENKIKSVVN